MVLIPSFTVYFAARAKEKKTEAKLALAQTELESGLEDAHNSAEE
jgi:hypothetical protein